MQGVLKLKKNNSGTKRLKRIRRVRLVASTKKERYKYRILVGDLESTRQFEIKGTYRSQ
jgi:hypothetical protein